MPNSRLGEYTGCEHLELGIREFFRILPRLGVLCGRKIILNLLAESRHQEWCFLLTLCQNLVSIANMP